jgi:hypothetical protein
MKIAYGALQKYSDSFDFSPHFIVLQSGIKIEWIVILTIVMLTIYTKYSVMSKWKIIIIFKKGE